MIEPNLQPQTKTDGTLRPNAVFFPSSAPLVPFKVVYHGSVTKPCTPTLRGQGDKSILTILTETVVMY